MTSIKVYFDKFVYIGLLLIIAFSPWLHGLELPWEIFLFSSLILLLLALTLTFVRQQQLDLLSKVKWSLSLLVLWLLWGAFYLVPLPSEWVHWISPNLANEMLLAEVQTKTLSVSNWLTLIDLARMFTFVGIFILGILLLANPSHQRRLLNVIFYSSAVMALYSQLNHFTLGEFELVEGIPPWNADWKNTVRGTFSYKNQYAIYVAMTTFIGIGLLVDDIKKQQAEQPIHSLLTFVRFVLLEKHVIKIATIMLMFLCLVGSNSRGGILVFCVVGGLWLIKSIGIKKILEKPNNKVIPIVSFVAAVFLIFSFLNSVSYERYQRAGLLDHGRYLLHDTAVKVTKEFFPIGSGPGTYAAIQHKYKPTELGNSDMSKRAHNDYLEFLASQGLMGALLFFTPLSLLLYRAFKPSKYQNKGVILGPQAAILCLLIHSMIDFNFSSLVFGMYLSILLALLINQKEARLLKGSNDS